MNRPIKFRAWVDTTGFKKEKKWEMLIPCEIRFSLSDGRPPSIYVAYERADGEYKTEHFRGEDVTLMQFTGLLDKNGKEIFESDRIRFRVGGSASSEMEDVVEWFDYYWGAGKTFGLGSLSDIEVIGNIYENPLT